MNWIWLFFVGLGLTMVASGLLLCLWSVWQVLLLVLGGRPAWRDYPDLDESLRKSSGRRWRQ